MGVIDGGADGTRKVNNQQKETKVIVIAGGLSGFCAGLYTGPAFLLTATRTDIVVE